MDVAEEVVRLKREMEADAGIAVAAALAALEANPDIVIGALFVLDHGA